MINPRYYFYLVFLTMLSNVMVMAPHVLLRHRFEGAMMSIWLAVPISMSFIYLFTKSIACFPGLTLPEIMEKYFPAWFRIPYTLQLALFWFWSGAQPLLAFARITKGFLNPEVSQYLILAMYLSFVCYAAFMDSKKVAYLIETILVMVAPLIFFILARSVFEPSFSWLSIYDMFTYTGNPPEYESLSAATYVYTGYVNMIIFNKSVKSQLNKWYMGAICLIGLSTLLTSFLIPVALLGKYTVTDYVFPWVSASDALRLEYFFLERVMLLFLMLYLFIVLLHSAMVWHGGLHLSRSLFKRPGRKTDLMILAVFCAGIFLLRRIIANDYIGFAFTDWFLDLRLPAEGLMVGILVYCARRQKKA